MYVPFDELPDSARLWIYQSDRLLSDDEVAKIYQELSTFVHEWTAHNKALKASFTVLHNIFVALSVDQSQAEASGCSIDSSVKQIKQLEQQLNVNFFDRTKVVLFQQDEPVIYALNELKTSFNDDEIDLQSFFFNILASSKGDIPEKWKTPIENTWLVRYIK